MQDKGDHWEYIFVYINDLGIASKTPQSIVNELINKYDVKLKGTGPIKYHLGCDYFWDKNGALCFAPKKYIKKILDSYQRMFGTKLKQYKTPLEKRNHPELDTSKELDLEGIKQYQSLIGAMQWAIQIRKMDITTAVITMSGFRAAPKKGHLEHVKQIYRYLLKMQHAIIQI